MERRHELTRLEGFSDAVFAFALTLLVVSLEVPKDSGELIKLMRQFLPFALMFAMICWIWYEHQQFFERYDAVDAWLVTLNCVLLFVVLFYVYPLKFLTTTLLGPLMDRSQHVEMQHGDIVMLLYSSGVVLIFGTFVAMYRHAWRKRAQLGLSPTDIVELQSGMRGHMISGGLGVASMAIVGVAELIGENSARWLGPASGFIYILMGPLHTWNGVKTGKALSTLKKNAPTV